MLNLRKIIIIIILLLLPIGVVAQEMYYQARVIDIIQEDTYIREDGSVAYNQYFKLEILEDVKKGEIIEVNNLDGFDVVNKHRYQIGDKVLVAGYETEGANIHYEITDYVRTSSLFWLTIIFFLLIVIIGKWKGVRALVGLALSFVVIMYFIIPRILDGQSPLLVGIIGAFIILCVLIYFTEGWRRLSHLSILAIAISLLITAILAIVFTNFANLIGGGSDEILFLIGLGENTLNLKGLLLTGIIIGTLGVLDDVVVSQVSVVSEIKTANPTLLPLELFQRAMKVGVTHIGAMINTLFLAYAGVSLPLLLLFSVQNPPFLSFFDVINNELIATEIVRTITGSIGLTLAAPIATIVAVFGLGKEDFLSSSRH